MEDLSENTIEKNNRQTFKKEERLCSKKTIDKLFSEGKSFLTFPLKVVYLKTPLATKFTAQAAFTVGKRNFKRAVDRNLIKRKIKEAYRLNKSELYSDLEEEQVAIFFIFIGKSIPDYSIIEVAIKKGINKLVKEITSNNS